MGTGQKPRMALSRSDISFFMRARHPELSSFEVKKHPYFEEPQSGSFRTYYVVSDETSLGKWENGCVPDVVEGGCSFLGGYTFTFREERPSIFFFAYTEAFVDVFFQTITVLPKNEDF